jgi:N-acetylneuraminate synthase/sialic acid synthase
MRRDLKIEDKVINDASECYVIAELGHNHQGSVDTCKDMIDAAIAAGASAVKLQKRDNKALFTKEMYGSVYNSENAYGATYGEHREFLEFGKDEYQELMKYSKEKGVTFFSTAFDFNSANFLHELDVPAFKMASGDLKNIPLLKHVAKFQRPMIVSTGGGTMEDVVRAYEAINPINPNFAILQCTAGYPPTYEEMNLNVIKTYRERFPDIQIGMSSHDSGIAMDLVAYILGARIIEKHFTLNRSMKGTDHAFSLEPQGLTKLVRDMARAKIALGDGVKRRYPSEEKPLYKMGKKLVIAKNLKAGHVLSESDFLIQSPGDGLPPYEVYNLEGKTLKADVTEGHSISMNDIQN